MNDPSYSETQPFPGIVFVLYHHRLQTTGTSVLLLALCTLSMPPFLITHEPSTATFFRGTRFSSRLMHLSMMSTGSTKTLIADPCMSTTQNGKSDVIEEVSHTWKMSNVRSMHVESPFRIREAHIRTTLACFIHWVSLPPKCRYWKPPRSTRSLSCL
jgi:hypothetical protein